MTFNEGSRLDPSRVQRRGRGSAGRGIAVGAGAGVDSATTSAVKPAWPG